ncbi:MAG: metallophosphoesterase family protein [Chloroflexota bacterium]
MKYAVFSDVHGNLEALMAVVKDVRKRRISQMFFVGDAVGYGPDPDECARVLKDECGVLIAGNHDWAVLGLTDLEDFNPYAREAIEWTIRKITEETRGALEKFILSKGLRDKNAFFVHATPRDPEKWHYLFSLWDAEDSFDHFEEKICFIGHSHQPFIIEKLPSGEMVTHRSRVPLGETERYIVNVGSVGQPRDGDPRASYAVFDGETITVHRVSYPVEKTQSKMRSHGLSPLLIDRLARGV